MNVLLMVPLPHLLSEHPRIPDLGLAYLASAVRKEGHTVHMLDWNCEFTVKEFQGYLKQTRPDVVGMKVFTVNMRAALKTMALIQSTDPSIPFVLGGPHISASRPQEIMNEFKGADFAFRGEAELYFPRLLKHFSGNYKPGTKENRWDESSFDGISGLVWRKNGDIKHNEPHLVDDLDTFDFPAWDLIHPRDYKAPPVDMKNRRGAIAPIITTRGCPSHCTFCAAYHVNGRKVRTRSAENVLEEIELLYNAYHVRQLMFLDTNFTFHKELVTGVCSGIIDKKFDLLWDCVSSEQWDKLDQQTYRHMYQAGCRMINIGIESGTDKIRKTIKKGGSVSEISRQVRLIRETGIKVRGFFLLGFPGETLEDMKKTIAYAFSLKLDSLSFEVCYPLPRTEVYAVLKNKYNIIGIPWESFDVYDSPYPLSELGSKDVTQLVRKSQRKARLRPADLYKILYGKILRRLIG